MCIRDRHRRVPRTLPEDLGADPRLAWAPDAVAGANGDQPGQTAGTLAHPAQEAVPQLGTLLRQKIERCQSSAEEAVQGALVVAYSLSLIHI